MATRFDLIGDIHGHSEELEILLAKLRYTKKSGVFSHPNGRRVIFLGDYIDRGPRIRRVLEIVRAMVDHGEALAILGNHEVNAMRYHHTGSDGDPLRPHTPKNTKQHAATLAEFPDREERGRWMEWFSTLPLSIEMPGLRAIHACWDSAAVEELRAAGPLKGATLEAYSRKNTPGYNTISRLINGPEALLPEGYTHFTADGSARRDIRVKWWKDLSGASCREAIFPDSASIPDLPAENLPPTTSYDGAPLTFFGHYALKERAPRPIASNLACLDYGTGKGGFLCAYRWDGEEAIDPGKFVTTNGNSAHEA